jgi:hypothetical protein
MPLGDPSPRSTLPRLRTVFCGDSLREASRGARLTPGPPPPGLLGAPGRSLGRGGPATRKRVPARPPRGLNGLRGCPIPARRSAVPGASAPAGLHRSWTAPSTKAPPPCPLWFHAPERRGRMMLLAHARSMAHVGRSELRLGRRQHRCVRIASWIAQIQPSHRLFTSCPSMWTRGC